MKFNLQILILAFICLASCKQNEIPPIAKDGLSPLDWLIPQEEIIDSGVGKDGIPSVDAPDFDSPEEINSFFDNRLVLGIEYKGELRAYPIDMLNWHEIINDDVNGLEVAITYCPLTGTGIGWGRRINGFLTTFGVSGLLYNTNLMPYDRRTLSTWSQQRLECVNGNLIGTKPQTYTLIETTFATWKKSFPNSKVMNANTGFDRRYSEYPYADYRTNQDLLFFPIDRVDERIPPKERVLGVIIDEQSKAYRFNDESQGIEIIPDILGEKLITVARSYEDAFIAAFSNPDGRIFEALQDSLPIIMKDEYGNAYDLIGRVIDGPEKGNKLEQPTAFMGYWFSWGTFYPDIELWDE